MELSVKMQSFSFPSSVSSTSGVKDAKLIKSISHRSSSRAIPALAETAASIAIAATVVGTAATLLSQRRTKSEESAKECECEVCGGSGICTECKGEGFVLKKLSDESAERARLTASNMATRYTAGLPKKWSYCTKCSSTRSCITCGGSGKISY